MSALPDQVQIECSECGASIIEDMEWVLEVGSENLICEDCYEAEQEGYLHPTSDGPRDPSLSDVIVEIGKWLIVPAIGFLVIEAIAPGLLPLMTIPFYGLIAGAYLTYYAHTRESWLAAIVGLWVLYRSAVVVYQTI